MAIKSLTLQAGERTSVVGKPVSNKILLSVPDDEYRAIRPGLEYLHLPSHFTLYEPSEKLECVYFLNGGLVSLIVPMRDGKTSRGGRK
jgi:hypothetical protein